MHQLLAEVLELEWRSFPLKAIVLFLSLGDLRQHDIT